MIVISRGFKMLSEVYNHIVLERKKKSRMHFYTAFT